MKYNETYEIILKSYIDRLKGQELIKMLSGLTDYSSRLNCGNISQPFKGLINFLEQSQLCHCEE